MATVITHALVGVALGRAGTWRKVPARFWLQAAACGMLPDADVLSFRLGITYGNMFGHRGLTHSLFFAAVAAALVTLLAFRKLPDFSRRWHRLFACFFLIMASHDVIDAMTTGGLGVAFFSPFDLTRYFLPWRFITVAPISAEGFFSRWGLDALASELVCVWLPMGAAVAISLAARACYKNVTNFAADKRLKE